MTLSLVIDMTDLLQSLPQAAAHLITSLQQSASFACALDSPAWCQQAYCFAGQDLCYTAAVMLHSIIPGALMG